MVVFEAPLRLRRVFTKSISADYATSLDSVNDAKATILRRDRRVIRSAGDG